VAAYTDLPRFVVIPGPRDKHEPILLIPMTFLSAPIAYACRLSVRLSRRGGLYYGYQKVAISIAVAASWMCASGSRVWQSGAPQEAPGTTHSRNRCTVFYRGAEGSKSFAGCYRVRPEPVRGTTYFGGAKRHDGEVLSNHHGGKLKTLQALRRGTGEYRLCKRPVPRRRCNYYGTTYLGGVKGAGRL